MKIGIIALLFIGFTQFGLAQNSDEPVIISLDGKTLVEGDVVDVYSFNDLKIESIFQHDSIYDHLEIQFVIVPFNATVLVFRAGKNTIRTINIEEHLSLVPITPKDISHVLLNVYYDETQLSSITVFTRKVETADDYFRESQSHARASNNVNAIWYLEQAIHLDPENIEYKIELSQLYWDTENEELAYSMLQEIKSEHPSFNAYLKLGYFELDMKEFTEATANFLKSLEYATTDDEKSDAHTSLGTTQLIQFNYEKAYAHYTDALKFNPVNIAALNNIASVCDEVNKADEKVGYFQRIIEADSSFYYVHVNIGFHYLGEEKFEEALNEFDQVLAIDSTEAATLNNKSFALLKLNRVDEAMTFVNKSLEYGPQNAYAYRNRALIKLEMRKNQSACDDLHMAQELKFTEQYGTEVVDLIKKHCK